MRYFLTLVMATGLAPGVQAGQPISESLVDCAMLYTISNRAFPERRDFGKGYALDRAKERLLEKAREQAAAEGQADAAAHVDRLSIAKAETWDAKGLTYLFTQDFRDWAGYCRSLAKHMKIELLD